MIKSLFTSSTQLKVYDLLFFFSKFAKVRLKDKTEAFHLVI